MPINQLFKKKPTIELLNELLIIYGISNLDDSKFFSRKELDKNDSLEKFKKIIPRLNEYYLPCKQKVYLININTKKMITILRQFLKLFNYYLFSKEKYIKNEKIIVYQIIPLKNKNIEKKNKHGGCIVSFD